MLLRRLLRPSLLRQPLAAASAPPTAVRALAQSACLRNIEPATTTAIVDTPLPPPSPATTIPSETLRLLPLLRAQPNHYATIHIQGFPFLVTAGDTVTLPFRLKGLVAGDVLRITHVSVLGSRDYTLKGNPWVDERLFSCRATVVEETSEPMRFKKKTKQRQRKIKTVKSKHMYTVLRIREVEVREP